MPTLEATSAAALTCAAMQTCDRLCVRISIDPTLVRTAMSEPKSAAAPEWVATELALTDASLDVWTAEQERTGRAPMFAVALAPMPTCKAGPPGSTMAIRWVGSVQI
jgi:hypothetical protein